MTRIQNPIIWADVPDVDAIRVGDTFYMVSTSMHSMPGCPIMRSKDLAHWELAHYVYDTFEENPQHNLEDEKGIYGKGSWAASLRFFGGYYYLVFNCNDTGHFYVYRTIDIEQGSWSRLAKIDAFFHDPALFFEEDGTPYVIYGTGDIHIVEMERDMSGIKANGVHQLLLSTPKENIGLRCEGGHAYKVNGKYYLLYIEWPTDGHGRRREVCYRADNLFGPYERKIVFDDDMGYQNQGIAQGCMVDTQAGDWYAILFQDHHAVGRIPYVLPMKWEEDWPMIGVEGKCPTEFEVDLEEQLTNELVISDEFDYMENKLALQWQWNHNPDNALWSVTERPGYLRLRTGRLVEKGIIGARNTLTQRTEGPACEAITQIDLSGLKKGDCTGMVAMQGGFGLIGIRKIGKSDTQIVMCESGEAYKEQPVEVISYTKDSIYFKIHFVFEDSVDRAYFLYSEDGKQWKQLGKSLKMRYTLDHFMGYRVGLYCYATEEQGGYADFAYFRYIRYI